MDSIPWTDGLIYLNYFHLNTFSSVSLSHWAYVVFQTGIYLLAVILVLFILYVIYRSYISPEIIVREVSEVGYDYIPKGPAREVKVARAQANRRVEKIPPPYPNGWFAIVESRDLKKGGILPVDALGQNLCVYRGQDGVARCVDAYCPHLGAHLGVRGTVCGNCIQCPFHNWRFGPNGELVHVPGQDTVPKGISLKTWTVVETEGAVWLWYDAEGRPPLWDFPIAPQLKTFHFRGCNIFTVNAHCQEIPENGADPAHLNAVHSTSLITQIAEKYPFLEKFIGCHYWRGEWWKSDPEYTAKIRLEHSYRLMKTSVFNFDADITQYGPGYVRILFSSSFGPVLVSLSVTPIAPLLQKVVQRVFTPTYNAPMGIVINRGECWQFERDVSIWNNKLYMDAPAYVRADKTIRGFRNWYSQFYSENSISFRDASTKKYDW